MAGTRRWMSFAPGRVHTLRISGEFALPRAIRRYLRREVTALLARRGRW